MLDTFDPRPLVSVQPSRIHGRGLFAACPIPAGTIIGLYEGPRTQTDGPYVLWIWDEDESLHGIDGANELRYVNHSTAPNVEFQGAELVALQDIASGEELTHHYGADWS